MRIRSGASPSLYPCHPPLIEEKSQHRRAVANVKRLEERLKTVQAERDELAAELAALKPKEQ